MWLQDQNPPFSDCGALCLIINPKVFIISNEPTVHFYVSTKLIRLIIDTAHLEPSCRRAGQPWEGGGGRRGNGLVCGADEGRSVPIACRPAFIKFF